MGSPAQQGDFNPKPAFFAVRQALKAERNAPEQRTAKELSPPRS